LHRIVFMGSKQAGFEACNKLINDSIAGAVVAIICPDDASDSRTEMDAFSSIAKINNIPLHIVKKSTETINLIESLKPTIVLVHGWYQIIPVREFQGVKFLGFHYSLLPKYRGNAPLVWQIINGETTLGVSFFQLTEGMDEGDLVDQREFHLAEHETIADALQKANKLVQEMLTKFLNDLSIELLQFKKQALLPPSYCGIRQPEDGRISWIDSAKKIHDFIRAQTMPYPGAFSFLSDGRKLTIWSAIEEKIRYYGVPGSVAKVDLDYVVVCCGEGAIRILEIDVDGLKINSPANILKSIKTRLI
jgi:methionyl-tRNA formyltransferase